MDIRHGTLQVFWSSQNIITFFFSNTVYNIVHYCILYRCSKGQCAHTPSDAVSFHSDLYTSECHDYTFQVPYVLIRGKSELSIELCHFHQRSYSHLLNRSLFLSSCKISHKIQSQSKISKVMYNTQGCHRRTRRSDTICMQIIYKGLKPCSWISCVINTTLLYTTQLPNLEYILKYTLNYWTCLWWIL